MDLAYCLFSDALALGCADKEKTAVINSRVQVPSFTLSENVGPSLLWRVETIPYRSDRLQFDHLAKHETLLVTSYFLGMEHLLF